jgi:hypothetical protein
MKSAASLLGLKVRDYFNSCNWQLLPRDGAERPLRDRNVLPKQAKIAALQSPIVLPRLTAEKFFKLCNWQLLPQLEPTGDETLTPFVVAPSPLTNLPCLTVTEFFGLCNWHSLPLEVRESPQPLVLERSPQTWQVKAFFQRVSWEGSSEIGGLQQASARLELISPAPHEMNLNNLSNLF